MRKTCLILLWTSYLHIGLTQMDLFMKADQFVHQGNLLQAKALLDEYVFVNPENYKALIKRSHVHRILGEAHNADADLAKAIALNNYADIYLYAKSRATVLGEHSYSYDWIYDPSISVSFAKSIFDKVDLLNEIKNRSMDSKADSLFLDALESLTTNKYEVLVKTLNGININDPNLDLKYDMLGLMDLVSGNLTESITMFDKAILHNENFSMAYHHRGLAHKLQGNYNLAINDVKTAINLDGEDARYYFTKAKIHEKLNNPEKAQLYYTNALHTDENYSQALVNRSLLLKSDGQIQEALQNLNMAIILNPNEDENYFIRGGLNVVYGDYDSAILDYDRYIAKHPYDEKALFNRGVAHLLKYDFNNGCADLSQGRYSHNPTSAQFYEQFCASIKF